MARLLVHVEGQTEETFVNEVLAPHLYTAGWQAVSARLVGGARERARRGGIGRWQSVQRDILLHLKEDPACHATTIVDYYALPHDWPGRGEAIRLPVAQRADYVERLVEAEIAHAMGGNLPAARFLAFVAMHEFEALLFSDCQKFGQSVGKPELGLTLQAVRDAFATPEEINDSPLTAPSKRLKAIFPAYNKPLFGNVAALSIGLPRIRQECPHFHAWLTRLERVAG